METLERGTGNHLTELLGVPLPNVCQCVFAASSHLRAGEDSVNHVTAVSYFGAFSSIRPVGLSPEGRGESCLCVTLCSQLCQCVHALVTGLSCWMRRGGFLFCQTPLWVGRCVHVSIEQWRCPPRAHRGHCSTCQRVPSHRLFAFTRCPAALR